MIAIRLFKFAIKAIICSVIAVILLIFAFFCWTSWSAYKPLMAGKFDSYEWKLARTEVGSDGRTKDLARRCKMYHDLTSNYLKKNMTLKEVEDLLGPIDSWSYCTNQKIKCHNYSMGVCYSNSWSIVPMSLHVCFNRDGRLLTYDRNEYCEKHWSFLYDSGKHAEMLGIYYMKDKEQFCADKKGVIINECGIDPW